MASGVNAMDLRRGITMAVDSVITTLKSRVQMISTSEEIAQVCTNDQNKLLFICQKTRLLLTLIF